MKNNIYLFISTILLFTTISVNAQDTINVRTLSRDEILFLTADELLELPFEDLVYLAGKIGMSIDELLAAQSNVSTQRPLTLRESPSIITIITSEEIAALGARNLIDVLMMIPDYSFSGDIDGVIGLVSRGCWGHEGKVLLLIDGHELNETVYSTLQFGNHYNINNIDKIEIIRGPGSSIYGGFAELGVINIVSKSGKKIDGLQVKAEYGSFKNLNSRLQGNITAGKKYENFEYDISAFYSTGNLTDIDYSDMTERIYKMKDGWSEYNTINVNTNLVFKKLKVGFMYDDYKPTGLEYSQPLSNSFTSYFGKVSYDANINERINFTPKIFFKYQQPWEISDKPTDWEYKVAASRLRISLPFDVEVNENLSIVTGFDFYADNAKILLDDEEIVFYNDSKTVNFQNYTAFSQILWKNKIVNLTIGGRVDYHSQSGTAFSPRVGINKVVNNWHAKLLYGRAYRSPSIENINLNQDIKPENTYILELETGYRFNSNIFATINFFDITLKNPIIYAFLGENEEYYDNFEATGSRGVEFEYFMKYTYFSFSANYSFYSAASKNKVDAYNVYNEEGNINENLLLASPQHKFSTFLTYNFYDRIQLSPSLVVFGKKYGYATPFTDNLGETFLLQEEIKPLVLLNFVVSIKNIFGTPVNISLGCYNILDNKYFYYQAYDGGYSPFGGASREFNAKISFNFR